MRNWRLGLVLLAFLAAMCVFGSLRLDIDEIRSVKDPYELLGGDYTLGYLRAHEWGRALDCAWRAYTFFWQYRPLMTPVLPQRELRRFAAEEQRFGYTVPDTGRAGTEEMYRKRLVVPEPARFYRNGAGVPLLTAVLRLPTLALARFATRDGPDLLAYQFHRNPHPVFILLRLVGILGGLVSVLLVYALLRAEVGEGGGLIGAALMAALPPAIMFFPNLHYDAVLTPFVLAAALLYARKRYVLGGICLGLAFASKNSAVFLPAALLIHLAIETWRVRRAADPTAASAALGRRARGLMLFGLVALAASSPFANPVSQMQEVLSPIVHRPHDPRAPSAEPYRLDAPVAAGTAAARASRVDALIQRVKWGLGYNLSLLLALLAFPLAWARMRGVTGEFALCMLAVSFPYRVVFGDGLGYRSLMYLPFFTIAAVFALGRRAQLAILALLWLVDLVFLLNPLFATGIQHS